MVEDFEPLQQPVGSYSCLPTAVTAILRYHGRNLSIADVSLWCGESPAGCIIYLAMDGLRSHDCSVMEITSNSLEDLRSIVNDEGYETPVLVTVKHEPVGAMDHAVIVLGFFTAGNGIEIVRFMDPLTGKNETLEATEFTIYWYFGGELAFIIS